MLKLNKLGSGVSVRLSTGLYTRLYTHPLTNPYSYVRWSHSFVQRHIGPNEEQKKDMLQELNFDSMDRFIEKVLPTSIPSVVNNKNRSTYNIGQPLSEDEAINKLTDLLSKDNSKRSLIGQGYYGTILPNVIKRNVLENPQWYTAYTPYQSEISQGRLEGLMNYQYVVASLCGMDISNASLLDEATATVEAVLMTKPTTVYISNRLHQQTVEVLVGRLKAFNNNIQIVDNLDDNVDNVDCAVFQYPDTYGFVDTDLEETIYRLKSKGTSTVCVTDLLALTMIRPPGELGFDIAVGSTQRFGTPVGYGGPHAAFIATSRENIRKMPGRIIGVSVDTQGRSAYRMILQTREQHIKKDKATSNICTSQALLANIVGFYAVYHGSDGLYSIANRTHNYALDFANGAIVNGYKMAHDGLFFDTVCLQFKDGLSRDNMYLKAQEYGYNLRKIDYDKLNVSFDELTNDKEVDNLLKYVFSKVVDNQDNQDNLTYVYGINDSSVVRTSSFLENEKFSKYRSETEMQRYLCKLANKDLTLTRSMIPLGSCTMKLNSATELQPLSWSKISDIHPYVPKDQIPGYLEMLEETGHMLATLTGMHETLLQPNAGSQGELTGLLTIKKYLEHEKSEGCRDICLVPKSSHGTNPASAKLAGFKIKYLKCLDNGTIDEEHLHELIDKFGERIGAMMITYPSTYGKFDDNVVKICQMIHDTGGLVYMDGANMNAMCGLTSPGDIGADVCHLNLHKTFCIPHGGGGPGVGPICVVSRLAPFLPGKWPNGIPNVASSYWGSASIISITWMYLKMMGSDGIKNATQTAILNANYMCKRLENHYPVSFKGANGLVAHEFIIDLKSFKKIGITSEDIAKRLIDYGFHAPTMSFPIADTLMIEPTESEPLEELDRFCNAMISIRDEIRDIENGIVSVEKSHLKNAPHVARDLIHMDDMNYRVKAAYPLPYLKDNKYWPPVSRVDNIYGDKNLDPINLF